MEDSNENIVAFGCIERTVNEGFTKLDKLYTSLQMCQVKVWAIQASVWRTGEKSIGRGSEWYCMQCHFTNLVDSHVQ